jgi:sarcosine oxidase subunit gamma
MLSSVAPAAKTASVLEMPNISLRQMPFAAMLNLRGPADDARFVELSSAIIGLPLPTAPNRFVSSNGRHCLWQGPDEWLIIDTDNKAGDIARQFGDVLADFHHAVTDVSGNRVTLRLSGHWATELLSVGCSLDFGAGAFLPGMALQTILARTPVTIMCITEAPTFDLLARRSLARYLQAWLVNAAGSVGSSPDFGSARSPALGSWNHPR